MALGFMSALALPNASAEGVLVTHDPIHILSDADFTAANGVVSGDGSAMNPYVIAGWDIDASNAAPAGIEISNTNACFMIRNVSVQGGLGTSWNNGIFMFNNMHALVIADSVFQGNYLGVSAVDCPGLTIWNTDASLANTVGIQIYDCDGASIVSSTASDNTQWGIAAVLSSNVTISHCVASGNDVIGITVMECEYSLLLNNTVGLSPMCINIDACLYTNVWGNDIPAVATANPGQAIRVLSSLGCEVYDNMLSTWAEGISVTASSQIVVSENDILGELWGGAAIGLRTVDNSKVVKNMVSRSLWGIWVAGASDILVDSNYVCDGTYGIGISRSVSNDSLNADRITITANKVLGCALRGIDLRTGSNDCSVTDNIVQLTGGPGIYIEGAQRALVSGNSVWKCTGSGIVVEYLSTTQTTVVGNEVSVNSPYGVELRYCSQTKVYHNNFINNTVQALQNDGGMSVVNSWDDGYPSGGNYWSDYAGSDAYSGAAQNEPGSDSIGDEPYMLDLTHKDSYPLMQPWNGSLPPPPPVPGRQVNVSEGTSVTVYEMTGWMGTYTFDLYTLTHGGGVFWTVAMFEEKYTVTSDGEYLTIHCYRNPPYPCSGTGVGNNIAAVKLNGVPGFDEGIWASFIVDYTVGTEGTAESRFNALGNDTQLGPYLNSPCTYLGDYDSELVLGFSAGGVVPVPSIEASIDFDMNSFNPTSKGIWVTAYIGLPEGYSVSDIDISTVMLNDAVPANGPSEVKDFDHDGFLELMVKFDRKAALETMVAATDVEVTVSGSLSNGTEFLGTDNITVQTGKLISTAIVGSLIGALAAEPSLTAIIILVFVSLLAIAVARPFSSRRKTN